MNSGSEKIQLPLLDTFLSIASAKELASYLGTDVRRLMYFAYRLAPYRRYRTFEIRKRNGGVRVICAPIKPLKEIQQKLARALSNHYSPRPIAYGYVGNRSILDNAELHKRQRWVLKIDLKDFFPSINFGRVFGVLQAAPFNFPPEIARVISALCVHENQLPQGAPTSPILSNVVCHAMDGRLLAIAKKSRCVVTRYADDIVFSTNQRSFPSDLARTVYEGSTSATVLGKPLVDIIVGAGFRINEEKVKLTNNSQRQVVTGLVTNEKVNVKREYVKELRATLDLWKKRGTEQAAAIFFQRYYRRNKPVAPDSSKFSLVVQGRLQFVGKVKGWNSSVYLGLARKLQALDSRFQLRQAPGERTSEPNFSPTFHILLEGKTDYLYLRRAYQALEELGYDLPQVYFEERGGGEGGPNLLRTLREYAKASHPEPYVFIFDRDDKDVLRGAIDVGHEYKNWGNNVFSLAIPVPHHRRDMELICIEHYLSDDRLYAEDAHGRRLYSCTEFDKGTGLHVRDPNLHTLNPKKDTLIYDSDVIDRTKQKNVALQKTKFAEYVCEGVAPFDGENFQAFGQIFNVLGRIQESIRSMASSS